MIYVQVLDSPSSLCQIDRDKVQSPGWRRRVATEGAWAKEQTEGTSGGQAGIVSGSRNLADALRLVLPKRRTLIGFTTERAFRFILQTATTPSISIGRCGLP